MSETVKFDTGKPRWDLVPADTVIILANGSMSTIWSTRHDAGNMFARQKRCLMSWWDGNPLLQMSLSANLLLLQLELLGDRQRAEEYSEAEFPMAAMQEVASVLTYGATKYEPHNWLKGTNWSRFYSAALRHDTAWQSGARTDNETGLSHLAHAACNRMFLLTYQLRNIGVDDRSVR